jgi:hypothetical protein
MPGQAPLGRLEGVERVFVAGRPAVMLGAGEAEWKGRVRASGVTGLVRPRLSFVVDALTRHGNPFDLDNLCSPVLGVVATGSVRSVWATIEIGHPEGVWLEEADPPAPPSHAEVRVRIAAPPAQSNSQAEILPEPRGIARLGNAEPLGLHLVFYEATAFIGNFLFDGPVKPLIDALAPIFGGRARAPHDHRVRDLRVVRAPVRGNGVDVTCWRL